MFVPACAAFQETLFSIGSSDLEQLERHLLKRFEANLRFALKVGDRKDLHKIVAGRHDQQLRFAFKHPNVCCLS